MHFDGDTISWRTHLACYYTSCMFISWLAISLFQINSWKPMRSFANFHKLNCQQVDTLWCAEVPAGFDKCIRTFRWRNILCNQVNRSKPSHTKPSQAELSKAMEKMAMLMTTIKTRMSCWYDLQSSTLYTFDGACIRGSVIIRIISIHFENS